MSAPKIQGGGFYGEGGLKQARDTSQALRGPCPARRGPFCLTVRVSTNEREVNLFQNDGKGSNPPGSPARKILGQGPMGQGTGRPPGRGRPRLRERRRGRHRGRDGGRDGGQKAHQRRGGAFEGRLRTSRSGFERPPGLHFRGNRKKMAAKKEEMRGLIVDNVEICGFLTAFRRQTGVVRKKTRKFVEICAGTP